MTIAILTFTVKKTRLGLLFEEKFQMKVLLLQVMLALVASPLFTIVVYAAEVKDVGPI